MCARRTGPDAGLLTYKRVGSVTGTFSGVLGIAAGYPSAPMEVDLTQSAQGAGQLNIVDTTLHDLCMQIGDSRLCCCDAAMPAVESIAIALDEVTGPTFGQPFMFSNFIYTITLAAPATEAFDGFIKLPTGAFGTLPTLPFHFDVGQQTLKGAILATFPFDLSFYFTSGNGYEVNVFRTCSDLAVSAPVPFTVYGTQEITVCKSADSIPPLGSNSYSFELSNDVPRSWGTTNFSPGQCFTLTPYNVWFAPGLAPELIVTETINGMPPNVVVTAITVTPPTAEVPLSQTGLGTQTASVRVFSLPGGATVTFRNGISLDAVLNGTQVVPPNGSGASGTLTGSFNSSTSIFTFDMTFTGLTSPATGATIHQGPIGVNGPVQFGLPGFPAATSGVYSNSILIPGPLVGPLLAGGLYVQIADAAFPVGEIRGQILP
jgi:CHRD domain.